MTHHQTPQGTIGYHYAPRDTTRHHEIPSGTKDASGTLSGLSADAAYYLVAGGISPEDYARFHFEFDNGEAVYWPGDECGCLDDRCIGFHHEEHEECCCLRSLAGEYRKAIPWEQDHPEDDPARYMEETDDLEAQDLLDDLGWDTNDSDRPTVALLCEINAEAAEIDTSGRTYPDPVKLLESYREATYRGLTDWADGILGALAKHCPNSNEFAEAVRLRKAS